MRQDETIPEDPKVERLRTIARMRMAGRTTREIGAKVGLTHGQIAKIIHTDRFDELLAGERKEALLESRRSIAVLSVEAVTRLGELVRDPDAKIAIKAVELVLAHTIPKIDAIHEVVKDDPGAVASVAPTETEAAVVQ